MSYKTLKNKEIEEFLQSPNKAIKHYTQTYVKIQLQTNHLFLLCTGLGWVLYRPLLGSALVLVSLVPFMVPLLRVLVRPRASRYNAFQD